MLRAVRQAERPLVLMLSPGDSLRASDAEAVAEGRRATTYRVTSDFHSGPAAQYPAALGYLADAAFTAANLSRFAGRDGTWLDLDMLDLGADSPWHGTPAARLCAAIWLMARSPLMFAGALPAGLNEGRLTFSDILPFHSRSVWRIPILKANASDE